MKGFSVFILALTLVFVVAVKSHATLISSYSEIAGLVNTTVDFEDLGACVASGHQFSFGCGQPYTSIGLTMGVQFPDNVDIGSDSGGISVRSATVYTGGLNNQNFYFTSAQQAVGFYYQDSTANFIEIKAYDDLSNLLETHSLSGGNGYGGFTRDTADILHLHFVAPKQEAELSTRPHCHQRDTIKNLLHQAGFELQPSASPIVGLPYSLHRRHLTIHLWCASLLATYSNTILWKSISINNPHL